MAIIYNRHIANYIQVQLFYSVNKEYIREGISSVQFMKGMAEMFGESLTHHSQYHAFVNCPGCVNSACSFVDAVITSTRYRTRAASCCIFSLGCSVQLSKFNIIYIYIYIYYFQQYQTDFITLTTHNLHVNLQP